MKIKYLGTAAAEGIPGVFCSCEVCRKSRALGGKNIRTRSQALIDDKILVDFPSDTYMHSLVHNIDLSRIETCIVTHSHFDHLYPSELWCRSVGIAHGVDSAITFYGTHEVYRSIAASLLRDRMDGTGRVLAKKIKPFVGFEAEGYTITPLRAHHDVNSDPVIYAIAKGGKSMLYANDTGFFPDETLKFLADSGMRFDLVSLDCTGGTIKNENYGRSGHMNLIANVKTKAQLAVNGNIDDKTLIVVNHFSHNGVPLHDELVAAAGKYGFIVSYDGMELEF